MKKQKIAITGTSYVGLSDGVLLALYNEVVTLDIILEKVEILNNKTLPIEDKEIIEIIFFNILIFEKYFINFKYGKSNV